MELRHLRYFVVAAEEENFNRAAARLFVAAPALSRRIRDLELELGVDLFERVNKRVRLSAAGQSYLVDVKRILAELNAAADRSRRTAKGEIGTLRIGFHEIALQHEPVRMSFHRFRQSFPNVELGLDTFMPSALCTALINGTVDGAFVTDVSVFFGSTPFNQSVGQIEVAADDYVLAIPKGHPLEHKEEIFLRELNQEPMIWLRRDVSPNLHDRLLAACRQGDLVPNIVQYAGSQATRLQLVSVGMGVALMYQTAPNPWPDKVIYRKISDLSLRTRLLFIWPSDNPSAILRRFLEVLQGLIDAHTKD